MLIAVVIASIKLYKYKYVTQFSDEGITLSDEIFMYNAIKCNDIIRLKMHRYIITYILLFVDDYKPYVQDQQFIKKLQIKWCVLRFGTPFVINTEQLEFMYKGVAQTIKEALLENNRGLIINEKFPFDVERKKL
jgi:hypothetical protein